MIVAQMKEIFKRYWYLVLLICILCLFTYGPIYMLLQLAQVIAILVLIVCCAGLADQIKDETASLIVRFAPLGVVLFCMSILL